MVPTQSNLTIEPLTSQNWSSFEKLFSGCQQCSECWCLNHRVDPKSIVTGEEARAAMKGLTAAGQVGGLLGFVNGECAAWLSVDPSQSQIGHDYYLQAGNKVDARVWIIHCVYIAPAFRGLGISKALIERGIEYAKVSGAAKILAFPIPQATRNRFPQDEAEFSGRLSTFKKLGFLEKEQMNSFYQVMELNLE